MIIQAVMALIGTVAFAILFSVPTSLYFPCGVCGAVGFTVYALLMMLGATPTVSIFFGSLCVGIVARFLAVFLKSPSTVFVITGSGCRRVLDQLLPCDRSAGRCPEQRVHRSQGRDCHHAGPGHCF